MDKVDYTFDGKYFENIETIGAFTPIINLKNAIKQENEEELNECLTILDNQHPQLWEFVLEHEESFDNFFKLQNNALLTLNVNTFTNVSIGPLQNFLNNITHETKNQMKE